MSAKKRVRDPGFRGWVLIAGAECFSGVLAFLLLPAPGRYLLGGLAVLLIAQALMRSVAARKEGR